MRKCNFELYWSKILDISSHMKTKLSLQFIHFFSSFKNELIICTIALIQCITITRNNAFFSGDSAMLGLIATDISNGKFYSWYFYGQDYNGNLWPFLLSIVSLFTGGLNITKMYFWELVTYSAVISILFKTAKSLNIVQIIILTIILFSPGYFTLFTFLPFGYNLVLLILTVFYVVFKQTLDTHNYSKWIDFATMFFLSLSLWYNGTILVIGLMYAVMVLTIVNLKNIKSWFTSRYLYIFSGLIIGLIPFILASIQTEKRNIAWFASNKTSSVKESLKYVINDLSNYWYGNQIIDIKHIRPSILYVLNHPEIVAPTIVTIGLTIGLIVLFWNVKTYKIEASLLIGLFIISANKGYGLTPHIFEYIRYNYFFVIFSLFFVLRYLFSSSANFKNPVNILLTGIVPILLLGSVSSSVISYTNAYQGPQPYDTIYSDIKSRKIKELYCENYFKACATLKFLTINDKININIIDAGRTYNQNFSKSIDNQNQNYLLLQSSQSCTREGDIIQQYGGNPNDSHYLCLTKTSKQN